MAGGLPRGFEVPGQAAAPPPPHMLVPMEFIMIQTPQGMAMVTTKAQCFCGCSLEVRFEHKNPDQPNAPKEEKKP